MLIVPPSCRACLVMSLKAASAAAARARSDKFRVGHYSGVDTCEHRDLVHQRRVGTAPTEGRKWDFSTVCCGRDLTAPRTTDRSSRIQASWLLDWIRERYTSMTIPDSHASASDETGRPEAHRVRDWGRTGGPPTEPPLNYAPEQQRDAVESGLTALCRLCSRNANHRISSSTVIDLGALGEKRQ